MNRDSHLSFAPILFVLIACSASSGTAFNHDSTGSGGGEAGSSGGTPVTSPGGDTGATTDVPGNGGSASIVGGGGDASDGFSAQVEQGNVVVTHVALGCADGCADVTAVASGGNPPYTYQWADDGSTAPTRRICSSAATTLSVSITDTGTNSGEFQTAPETVTTSVPASATNCSVGVPVVPDGGTSNPCDLGSAVSAGSAQSPDLFGQIGYFDGGAALPAGRYRATYVDGCMKYDFVFGWQVQAAVVAPGAVGTNGWLLVGDTSDDRVASLPGVATAFTDFDACVTGNLAAPPVDFDFKGGKLGVWLLDSPYQDNVAGENGRNPKWTLTRLDCAPPP